MEHIINQQFNCCQSCKYWNEQKVANLANSLSFRAKPHATFNVPNIVPALAKNGFVLLPGLTKWFEILSPFNNGDAWEAFADKNVAEIIRSHPKQQQQFFLNDSSRLDNNPQLSVDFVRKAEKSHLTVAEGAEAICDCSLFPAAIQSYLKSCNEFIRHFRDILSEILPKPAFPTILRMRIFEYHASDLTKQAMKPHMDGSVCTLIIAQSDGLLHFAHHGQWYSATRPDKKPFALVVPGVAAAHAYGVSPTPHMVLAGTERRVSLTIFHTPVLSATHEMAEQEVARLCLQKSPDEISIAA
jgi:hypothetical protein